MKASDKPKLIIAVVLFVLAAVVILWQMGVFSGGSGETAVPAPVEGQPQRAGGARTPGK